MDCSETVQSQPGIHSRVKGLTGAERSCDGCKLDLSNDPDKRYLSPPAHQVLSFHTKVSYEQCGK